MLDPYREFRNLSSEINVVTRQMEVLQILNYIKFSFEEMTSY